MLLFFCQKRPAADFIDPLVNKKPRISHLTIKAATATVNDKLGSCTGRGDAGPPSGVAVSMPESGTTSSSQHLPVLDIPRPFEALSDVSNDSSHNGRDCDSQEMTVSERLSQPLSITSAPTMAFAPPSISMSSPGHSVLEDLKDKSSSSFNKSRKKSKKHKEKERSKDKERAREKNKEKKNREEHVPEPDRNYVISPGNFKGNSIPLKSTSKSKAHAHTTHGLQTIRLEIFPW